MANDDIQKSDKFLNLEGIIIPTSWDEKGNPTGFSLFTFDEREFKLLPIKGNNKELLGHIRQQIRGTFRKENSDASIETIVLETLYSIGKKKK